MTASRRTTQILCFLLSLVLGSGVAHACLLADRLRVVAPHLSEAEVQALAHGSMKVEIIPYAFRGANDCVDGMAHIFSCENIDLVGFIELEDIGGGNANDLWGWTDPVDGTEYALIGRSNGMAFVDISEPSAPVYVGNLPTQTGNSTWRDVKVYQDHAFIVSDNNGNHGMQVFDLTQLRSVLSPPQTFSNTAHYSGIGSAHNVVINEDTGFSYVVGSSTCGDGGLHIVDITTPASPVFAGCFSSDGYTHDAQCVIYNGPDTEHNGKEICFNSNEDTVTIVDVTNKAAPIQLSRTGYSDHGYTHQGWLTEDMRYFVHDDELDELQRGHNTRTYTWDLSDLDAPTLAGHWDADGAAIDHNQYIKGNHTYQANYRRGLRILALTDPASGTMTEAAFFDTYPEGDGNSFAGAWSVYPYFESGLVIVSDISRGLFILRPDLDGMILKNNFESAQNSHIFGF